MNALIALSLLLAPPAAAKPDLRTRMIQAVPECAKRTDTDRMVACDAAARMLLVEPRKSTALFVALWSTSQFNQPVAVSRDYLHIYPAGLPRPDMARTLGNAAGATAVAGALTAVGDPDAGADLLLGAAALGISAGATAADSAHERKMDHRIGLEMIRAIYTQGGDSYCSDMLRALDQVDWKSGDSIDRFVAAHEQALAAGANAAPAQPTPPTGP